MRQPPPGGVSGALQRCHPRWTCGHCTTRPWRLHQTGIDGGAPVAVTDTNAPVRIQLALADSLINTDTTVKREYKIVRFHYDSVTGQTVVDILDASYHAGYNKLAFNTDKFSVYAVVYKDTNNSTEDFLTDQDPAPGVIK